MPICSQLRLRLKDYTPSPNPEDYLFPGIDGRLSFDILTAVKRTAIPKPHDLGFGRELLRSTKAHAEVRTETGDGRQETGDGRRETGDGRQLLGIGFEFSVHCFLTSEV